MIKTGGRARQFSCVNSDWSDSADKIFSIYRYKHIVIRKLLVSHSILLILVNTLLYMSTRIYILFMNMFLLQNVQIASRYLTIIFPNQNKYHTQISFLLSMLSIKVPRIYWLLLLIFLAWNQIGSLIHLSMSQFISFINSLPEFHYITNHFI